MCYPVSPLVLRSNVHTPLPHSLPRCRHSQSPFPTPSKTEPSTIQDFIQAISIVKLYKNVPLMFERPPTEHTSPILPSHRAGGPRRSGSARDNLAAQFYYSKRWWRPPSHRHNLGSLAAVRFPQRKRRSRYSAKQTEQRCAKEEVTAFCGVMSQSWMWFRWNRSPMVTRDSQAPSESQHIAESL